MFQILVAIFQKFCCRKEAWAMQKLLRKKEKEKKDEKKWTQKCPRY